jgi:hypothetical protein
MEKFVEHVISEVPISEKIIIKTHPLDNDASRFEKFSSERVEVIHFGEMEELLSGAKAVVGINSTVLMQALDFSCNIYCYGRSLLDNKKVSFNFSEGGRLNESWCDFEYHSHTAKKKVKLEFVKRQINVQEIKYKSVSELLERKSFAPLVESSASYPNSDEYKQIVSRLNGVSDDLCKHGSASFDPKAIVKEIEDIKNLQIKIADKYFSDNPSGVSSRFGEKNRFLRKLKDNPYLYFKDSKHKLIRPLRHLFSKRIL